MTEITKIVKGFKQEVREKTIEEFVEAIANKYEGEDKGCIYVSLSMIERIAEELKGGDK